METGSLEGFHFFKGSFNFLASLINGNTMMTVAA